MHAVCNIFMRLLYIFANMQAIVLFFAHVCKFTSDGI